MTGANGGEAPWAKGNARESAAGTLAATAGAEVLRPRDGIAPEPPAMRAERLPDRMAVVPTADDETRAERLTNDEAETAWAVLVARGRGDGRDGRGAFVTLSREVDLVAGGGGEDSDDGGSGSGADDMDTAEGKEDECSEAAAGREATVSAGGTGERVGAAWAGNPTDTVEGRGGR
jgi:hypothetical protein